MLSSKFPTQIVNLVWQDGKRTGLDLRGALGSRVNGTCGETQFLCYRGVRSLSLQGHMSWSRTPVLQRRREAGIGVGAFAGTPGTLWAEDTRACQASPPGTNRTGVKALPSPSTGVGFKKGVDGRVQEQTRRPQIFSGCVTNSRHAHSGKWLWHSWALSPYARGAQIGIYVFVVFNALSSQMSRECLPYPGRKGKENNSLCLQPFRRLQLRQARQTTKISVPPRDILVKLPFLYLHFLNKIIGKTLGWSHLKGMFLWISWTKICPGVTRPITPSEMCSRQRVSVHSGLKWAREGTPTSRSVKSPWLFWRMAYMQCATVTACFQLW